MSKVSYRAMTGPDGLLSRRAAFTGNSLSAEWTDTLPHRGRLDDEEYDRLQDAFDAAHRKGGSMYVVYSYVTPIAWAMEDDPSYCVEQHFSVTTSKGQGYVRAWIDYAGGPGYEAYRAERERLGI